MLALVECNSFADWVLGVPTMTSHGLINHAHQRSVRVIVVREHCALHQRLADGLKIVRAHYSRIHQWRKFTSRNRFTLNLKRHASRSDRDSARIEREITRSCRGLNSSNR